MTKKKAKGKGKAVSKKSGSKRKESKELNPGQVRRDIAQIVQDCAVDMVEAVALAGKQGQLAPAKFLLEVGGIYPPASDGSMASSEYEESLAATLCKRLNIPAPPLVMEEERDEPVELPPLPVQPVESVNAVEEELVGV